MLSTLQILTALEILELPIWQTKLPEASTSKPHEIICNHVKNDEHFENNLDNLQKISQIIEIPLQITQTMLESIQQLSYLLPKKYILLLDNSMLIHKNFQQIYLINDLKNLVNQQAQAIFTNHLLQLLEDTPRQRIELKFTQLSNESTDNLLNNEGELKKQLWLKIIDFL